MAVNYSQLRLWRAMPAAVAVSSCVALFIVYLRLARIVNMNADGASNTLQAWDLLHGNVLLHGWTVSDVPFYTVELVEFALIELVTGLRPDAPMVGAAANYTLIVVLVAMLARGRARGRLAWLRVAVALSFVLVPPPGSGNLLLNQPDHTATAVPLLLTWLVLDRATVRHDGLPRSHARWLPMAVAGLLAWGQMSDPLLTLVGALPLVLVSLARLVRAGRFRPRDWRCLDAALVAAGLASVLAAQCVSWLLRRAGGFLVAPLPSGLILWHQLPTHLVATAESVSMLLGCYFPQLSGLVERTLGVVHLVGVLALVAAVVLVAVPVLGRRVVGRRVVGHRGTRLEQLLGAGLAANLAAYTVSTVDSGVASAREIAPILPMSAVLVATVLLPDRAAVMRRALAGAARHGRRSRVSWRITASVAIVVIGLLVAALVDRVQVSPAPPDGQPAAEWLAAHHQIYGLGGYWTANPVTLDTSAAVRVLPVTSHGGRIQAYDWETRPDWYDPGRHDARFIVIDLQYPGDGTVAAATAQFGPPVQSVTLRSSPHTGVTIMVYDHNLLAGLPAWCGATGSAPSIDRCPT